MSTSYASSSYGPAGGEASPQFGPWSHRGYGYGPPFPVKAAIVIGGLALFPPLGLAALAYFALRHKFGPGGWGPGGPRMGRRGGGCGGHWHKHEGDDERDRRDSPPTGNSAFEARRREVLDKIEAERAKLAAEAQAFRDFSDKERRARDQAEFDRFMTEKDKPADGGASNG